MAKQLLIERFQQLAGIKPLYETDYADRLANSGTDSDGRNTWGDKTGYSDEEMAQGKGKLKKYPDKDGRNVWGDKTDYSDVPFGGGNPKLEEWKEIDNIFEEANRAAQGWLEKWINEPHIAKALEDYNQGWNNFEDNTLSTLNFISTASPAEDMIGSGGTTKEYKK